jgi:transketolase
LAPIPSTALVEKAVNTIRMLAADGVQKANSGHPGMPMGAADMAFVLWTRHLRFDPSEPRWIDRDRFVLSAGHGSMLVYSLLHLAGYDVTLEDLKNFRQKGSRTPGHPEFGHTAGVEVTSGPLGQGFANAVGMALGQAMLSARLGPGNPVEDHFVYAIVSDGDLMEGVAAEAASVAGHLRLGRCIFLYDDNEITIDGRTSLAFSGEDVSARFASYGWHVQQVDGRDHDGISKAIDAAQGDSRPSLIRVRTVIGYGSPGKQGKSSVHGAPLGEEELKATKEFLGWPLEPRFLVPDDVRAFWTEVVASRKAEHAAWKRRADAWRATHPEQAALLDAHVNRTVPADLAARLLEGADASDATRKISQAMIQKAAALVPALVGGSADLAESNLTDIKGAGGVAAGSYGARNVHYGIREHAMGSLANGLAYDGNHIPFVGTFFVFSDYMKPPVRIAALAGLQVIYVWTHDSIFLGEDGPTHQPVETLANLRAIPNLLVIRPGDGNETVGAYKVAVTNRKRPTVLALSRQAMANQAHSAAEKVALGGYVLEDCDGTPDLILIGTGTELDLCVKAAAQLRAEGKAVRVVSMPCIELFEEQDAAYRESVLPAAVRKRVVVEASSSFGWHKYTGFDGDSVSIDSFGASAPGGVCLEKFGFTVENVVAKAKALG